MYILSFLAPEIPDRNRTEKQYKINILIIQSFLNISTIFINELDKNRKGSDSTGKISFNYVWFYRVIWALNFLFNARPGHVITFGYTAGVLVAVPGMETPGNISKKPLHFWVSVAS